MVNIPGRHLFSLSTEVLVAGIFKIDAQSGETDGQTETLLLQVWSSIIWQEGSWLQYEMLQQYCCDSSSIKILVLLMTTAIFLADDSTKARVASVLESVRNHHPPRLGELCWGRTRDAL